MPSSLSKALIGLLIGLLTDNVPLNLLDKTWGDPLWLTVIIVSRLKDTLEGILDV